MQNEETSSDTIRFKNAYQVEDRLCEAFASLGALAGINVGGDVPPAEIELAVIDAVEQAYHGDPHFLNGPGIFVHTRSLAQVETIFVNANAMAAKLKVLIENRGGAQGLRDARRQLAIIDAAHDWAMRRYSVA